MTDEHLVYLSVDDLIRLTQGHGTTVGDHGLLASAAARPRTTVAGQDAYPSLQEKAAALADSLSRNHALVDGNKRLELGAVVVFLSLNGYALDLDEDGKVALFLAVAAGELRGVAAIAARMPLRAL